MIIQSRSDGDEIVNALCGIFNINPAEVRQARLDMNISAWQEETHALTVTVELVDGDTKRRILQACADIIAEKAHTP